MPAKDTYHDLVKESLVLDGWTITHDPFVLKAGDRNLFVDLGANKVIAATKSDQLIAVEIKGFHNPSPVKDIQHAIGQYMVYRSLMLRQEPERVVYLAMPAHIHATIMSEVIGRIIMEDYPIKLLVYDIATKRISTWID